MPDETRNSWQPIDLRGLGDVPSVTPNAYGLYPGKRHVFKGEGESCKTLYAFALGLEEVRAGGRVLHFDFEMFAAPTRERLREMGATDDELDEWIHLEPEEPPGESALDDLLYDHPATLAIIDAAAGAYDALGLDDNARKDVERFARMIVTPLTRAGIATIVIDHVVKNPDKALRKNPIGSERKAGGVDVMLDFETIRPFHRGGSGLVKISVHRDRFGHLPRPTLGELHLESDDWGAITWQLRDTTTTSDDGRQWKPTQIMEKVSRHLALQAEPVNRGEIVDALGGQRKYVLAAIDHLVADGYATETSGPRGAKLTAHAKPFRVPDPFSPVPENGSAPPVLPFSLSTERTAPENGSSHDPDQAEAERLALVHADLIRDTA